MKSSTFNYSLLAIGVAAILGMSTTVNAVETSKTSTSVEITNKATASYNVSGQAQPEVESNTVKITVTEQTSFSLVPAVTNTGKEVAPNGFVQFTHTLTNTGNRTDNYAITTPTAPAGYDTANSTVSYKIYNELNVEDTTRTTDNAPYGASSGRVFPLEKGHYIVLVINAKTTGNKGGETKPLEISAVSSLLGTDKTLINTDTSFTRLPTFSIVKTIINGLDLNNLDNDTATYRVVVTNDGNTAFTADATDIAIADILPDGLVMAEALTLANIKTSSTATKGTIDPINTGAVGTSGFNITGINIPVGQNITIEFKVKKGTGTLTPATAINHVTVTDDLDNNPNTDNTLIDSTDTSREQNVGAFYPTTEINNLNGQRPANPGDDSTLPLSSATIQRALTLTGSTFREISPTSGTLGQVKHQTVITNTGKDVEGIKAEELTFTINDNDGNLPDQINIVPNSVTVTYYPNGNDTTTPTVVDKTITAVDGVYDLFSALPNGIAPNGTVTIKYNVSSANAKIFTPINSTTPTFEETVVTLIPGKEGAPQSVSVTDRTTVRGLTLLKTQAINADCVGTPPAANFVSTDIKDVSPGQCIVYKVQAKNTSSADTTSPTGIGFDIKNIVISDAFSNFSNEADYVANSVETTNGTTSDTGTAITNNIDMLAPQATETMQFKVKVKTARVVTPTP
ncbi:hypothetical protein [Psychrobacter cryohalolentis]|uniref:DUF11 domain-containing protein n=1 Tax=Psychrobacter cryohalolentis (strain ATCC BAA-1226 / DSM 17306 / VKM B-2378 / K5) TaxID=335284 RepID=Q1QBX5_PSYCK|nr:hypothetical protein [Psychrobacter cryohalolentis]ABE74828.1 hypothetical protein Pcryo_1047 [Psychrobacter cryohalolentis K5]ASE27436.1 hypothetical protein CEP87_12890 [Psychrobacter cryohalolentis]